MNRCRSFIAGGRIVVHLHGELSCQDVGLVGLHLARDLGLEFPLQSAQRREPSPLNSASKSRSVVLGVELAIPHQMVSVGRRLEVPERRREHGVGELRLCVDLLLQSSKTPPCFKDAGLRSLAHTVLDCPPLFRRELANPSGHSTSGGLSMPASSRQRCSARNPRRALSGDKRDQHDATGRRHAGAPHHLHHHRAG